MRRLEVNVAVDQHHRRQVLQVNVRHRASVDCARALLIHRDVHLFHIYSSDAVLGHDVGQCVQRCLDGVAHRPALDGRLHDVVTHTQPRHQFLRFGIDLEGMEKAAIPSKHVFHAREASRHHGCRRHAVARWHATEVESLFNMLDVARPA